MRSRFLFAALFAAFSLSGGSALAQQVTKEKALERSTAAA